MLAKTIIGVIFLLLAALAVSGIAELFYRSKLDKKENR
jgi:hypothetical protein